MEIKTIILSPIRHFHFTPILTFFRSLNSSVSREVRGTF